MGNKYSFIVPVYNCAQHLEECLNSLLAQSYQNFEIVLIDDGSTDGSGEICNRYASACDNVKVLHVPNGGVSAARNLGIEACAEDADYLCFVDADDVAGERLLQTAEQGIADADVFFFGYTRKRSELFGGGIGSHVCLPVEVAQRQAMIDKTIYDDGTQYPKINCNTVWAKIYRASVVRSNRICFAQGIKIGEDRLFNFRVFQHCEKMRYTDDTVYFCRDRLESATSAYMADCYKNSDRTFEMFEELIGEAGGPQTQRHYRRLLDLRSVPVLRNCLALCFCHRNNPASLKQRAQDYRRASAQGFALRIPKCDRHSLQKRDQFYLWLASRPFRMIDIVIKYKPIRAAAMIITRPFIR